VIRHSIYFPDCPASRKRLLAATPVSSYAANKLFVRDIRLHRKAVGEWAKGGTYFARTGCGKKLHHAVSHHAC